MLNKIVSLFRRQRAKPEQPEPKPEIGPFIQKLVTLIENGDLLDKGVNDDGETVLEVPKNDGVLELCSRGHGWYGKFNGTTFSMDFPESEAICNAYLVFWENRQRKARQDAEAKLFAATHNLSNVSCWQVKTRLIGQM
jgi:hypothetical protein